MAVPETNDNSNSNSNSNGQAAGVNGHSNGANGHSNGANGHSDSSRNGTFEPIAIIGMGMRLPGGVRNAESFWDLLVNGRDGRCEVPKNRYNIDTWYGPGRVTHVGTKHANFLEDLNYANIDASFWSFTKQEAELLDPQQRLFLEVVYEAFESAGKTGWRGKDIGVYVGALGEDWSEMEALDAQDLNPTRTYVYGDYIIANRASYEFDLKGPSMMVRTACSSSLMALHLACQDIHSGDARDGAIVGGINIIISPRTTVALTEQGVLSEDGRCKTFDAAADGYARGEGVSAIYIKKLSDAIRDGDPIRSVIRSTCIAADGKTAGFTLPNDESHEKLMRRGHELAGITDFSKTAMVECHGTGTAAGDPREVSAVARVFGEHGVYIGSVKPNIGHGEGASGLSSIMKMTLALEHKTIPPNINFKTPNPKIPWEEAKLTVPTKPLPWPIDRLERVSVNSFGIGGANAHVVLESAASWGVGKKAQAPESDIDGVLKKQLLVFSAKHQKSLEAAAQRHEEYLTVHPDSLADMAYTLNNKREVYPIRAFTVTDGLDSFQLSRVVRAGTSTSPNLVFVFTGQGAQWARMGRELLGSEGIFKQTIEALDATLSSLPDSPQWTLREEILKPKKTSRLAEAELSQPCCTAIQVALVDLLRSWGVAPTAVVGHSSGEIAAAYSSGAISAEDAIRIAYYRGQCTLALKESYKGGMAAIGLGRESVKPYLRPGVIVGCENSSSSVTLTGDLDVLETVMEDIRAGEPSALVRALRVECAYHSHHMQAVAKSYAARLGAVEAKTPAVPFYSSVTADSTPELSTQYWVQNLVSPVLFSSAVDAALQAHDNVTFVELGPHSALQGPIRQTIQASQKTAEYMGTLVRDTDAYQAVLSTAGNLWLSGYAGLDLHAANGSPDNVKFLTNLPNYSWNYTELWLENRISRDFRLRQHDHHELLGSRVLESADAGPAWRCKLRVQDAQWLSDHDILGDIIFPGAGYLAMAGEAVKQLRPGTDDFTLRRVTLSAALVLHGDPVELITTLTPVRLTTSIDSDWFTFTISSVHPTTNVWTKHVSGQVRAGRDDAMVPNVPGDIGDDLPRKVPTSSMYSVWRRFGLNYGESFRGLDNISAHTTEKRAAGTIYQRCTSEEAAVYSLHPGSIDAAFHLSNVSLCHGLGRNFRTPSVPKYIDEMYVGTPDGPIRVVGNASPIGRGGSTSNIVGVCNGKVVLSWKALELSPLSDGSDVVDDDPHAAAILEWKADIDFVDDMKSLLLSLNKDMNDPIRKLVDTMGLVCIVESHHQLAGVQTDAWHLDRFRDWLGMITQQAVEGRYSYVENCEEIPAMSSADRIKLIEDNLAASYGTEAEPVAISLWRTFKNAAGFFSGEADSLDVLMQDNILMKMYDFTNNADAVRFLKLLGHKKPVMKVLEIGAGTGGTTATILAALVSDQGERLYGTYVHTDISSGFAIGAKERFKDYEAIEYRTLDITLDPEEQGFELGSFDLICSSNCLHATPNLIHTLKNVRKLLRPDGRLFLMELSPEASKSVNYVMGPLVGWWLSDDGRDHEPYVSADVWNQRLLEAGFSGVEAWAFDGNTSNSIVARPAISTPPSLESISIVTQNASHPTVASAIEHLKSTGMGIDIYAPGAGLPIDRPAVFLLDLEAPFLASVTEAQFNAFKHTLFSAPDVPSLWVTGACQIACVNPNYALINGISRSVRQETGLDFITLELERFDAEGWRGLSRLLATFPARIAVTKAGEERETDFESEYAFHSSSMQVGRMHWIKINDELKEKSEVSGEQVKRLVIEKPGIIQTLKWRMAPARVQQSGDWVTVEPRAVGLNFKDVLVAMGIVDSGSEGYGDFGFEGAGVVTSIGPDVKTLSLGDRVAFSSTGCFATSLTMAEIACAKLPEGLGFDEAATMPCVYGTALYGLENLARLVEGQTVLIHSACGGVGQAAIQIAKMIGAEVYCTVGNEEKIEYLVKTFAIPRDHIFNSRDSSFLPGIFKATEGKGVDVVLNSLSGELLHHSWQCVAKFGTMVEIGKRDFIGKAELAMDRFENNRTFVGLDHTELWAHKPKTAGRVLQRVMQLCSEGKLGPITPIKTFEAFKVEEAFRYMQKGQHIGKIVVTVPEGAVDLLNAAPGRREIHLRGDRTYIFAGGLGGLGQSIATYLVQLGARHLIFFSRSASKFAEESPWFGKELESMGCHVQFIGGSINEFADVEKVVASAITPIGGVLQAAMVLKDMNFVDMTYEAWETSVLPKVTGTWNFEEALKKQAEPLDFFFLFSSVSGTAGQIGQANYAAGNTFMDAYVQYRRSQGLACSTLAIGIMEDVGFLARERHLLEALRATSLHFLHEQDLLDAMELMLGPWASAPAASPAESSTDTHTANKGYVNPGHVILGLRSKLPLLSPMNRTGWKKNPRLLVYRNIEQHDSTSSTEGGASGTDGSLKEFLTSCGRTPEMLTADATIDFLAGEIGATLFNFMMRGDEEPDLNVPLAQVGVDSLVSIELRNWFRQKVGVPFTVVEIVGAGSIKDLGKMTAEKLAEKYKRT